MLEIITKKEEWDGVLSEVDMFDFYHSYDYHKNCAKENEESVLFCYREDAIVIALPLLIRPIKDTSYFDATSVYGYGGPLSKNITAAVNVTVFYTELQQYLSKRNIIAVYSSLNSYIDNQKRILSGLGKIEKIGKIVNIRLDQSISEQEASFSKTTRRYTNRNKKIFYSRFGNTQKDVDVFIALYYKTMNRLEASEGYFFKEEYFYKLMESNAYTAEVIFAITKDTHQIASAVLFVKTNNTIIQYHLSGTLEEYKHLSPIRFLLNEIRIQGTNDGYTYFNLGGGFGGKQDSLFDFKASFSNDYQKFKVWKYIVNPKIYNALTRENTNITARTKTKFFPLYRYKNS
ncbi:aminoacyltransferase [Cellulophaga sp. F20128]|uniref:GNAT family N-acetyltransferase n=1 Tax=Cellulophaga sp. F20128 TaxID=2926413 RepID=UPI001FF66BE5|nr:GNAT family N-acetyltransferase [Cellulophaga sp. F20128]MCK0156860.1 aminoacyltransferase [Cellulophaga sp. F20128]